MVADAGMLSASNLRKLDQASLRFIVGSRVTKAPNDLACHLHWHGDAFTDRQVIDTITPRTGKRSENPWLYSQPDLRAALRSTVFLQIGIEGLNARYRRAMRAGSLPASAQRC